MLNRSASLAMSTSVLKALPGKLDIKRHTPSILYISSRDMRDANTIGADKYFHSKANYEAANRGTGGRHAAALIR